MSVYQDKKNKTWYYTYRQNGKQLKKRGFRTKREAVAAELYARNEKPVVESITLDQLYTLWMEKGKNLKPDTISQRISTYNCSIEPFFHGDTKISNIDADMISDWMEWLHEGRSEVTVNNIRGRMHALMAFGVQLGTIKLNPVSAVPRMVIPKQLDEPENFWEPQEFERFMVTMTDMRYIALFSLMWYTGMRIGEVLALKWKNVDLNKRTISIVENLVYGAQEGTGSYLIVSPKTRNSIRKIDIPAKLYDIMLPWYEHQRKLDGFNENYFVFGDRRALGVASPTYALRRGIEKSGVKRITLHGFRHSHASYLINADIDDRLIAERLGHSVDMLHKVYAHIYKAKRNELKSRLDEIF